MARLTTRLTLSDGGEAVVDATRIIMMSRAKNYLTIWFERQREPMIFGFDTPGAADIAWWAIIDAQQPEGGK